ncbi:hypothetical protein SLEP1_g29364 [Rubroshorea leprosula]|uniref:Uncharacterized protein n=1 Tax=Rubroshorea leprosula TaxID=152421 RepID=A0AAV5K5Q9_9ROSI|nr:hypothetical protein SLEP1_g29364 [Rubroshorea leprosula]
MNRCFPSALNLSPTHHAVSRLVSPAILNLAITTTPGPCCPATLTAHLQLSSKAAAGSSHPASHRGTMLSTHHYKSTTLLTQHRSPPALNGGDFEYPWGPIIPRGDGDEAIFDSPPKFPTRIPVPAIDGDGDGDGEGSPPPWGPVAILSTGD